jgi:hypothetical protein
MRLKNIKYVTNLEEEDYPQQAPTGKTYLYAPILFLL